MTIQNKWESRVNARRKRLPSNVLETMQTVTSSVGKGVDRLTICSLILVIILLSLPFVIAELPITVSINSSGTILYVFTRPLHVEGRYIKDDQGNVVLLGGVNKGGYNNYPTGRWQAQGELSHGGALEFRESAVHYQMGVLRDQWHVNCMRWTITCQWWIENSGNYRYNIRRAIEIAGQYGIYIIFAPWRVSEETLQDDLPFPPYSKPQAQTIITSVDDFVDFWVSVANEIGDLPNVIFDLWNEPAGGSEHGKAVWQDAAQRCIDAIRDPTQGNSNALVLYQYGYGTGVNKRIVDWYIQYPVNGSNVVISTHLYLSGYGYSSNYTILKSQMETSQIELVAQPPAEGGLNMSLLIGEVGGLTSTDEIEWFTNVLAILNEWEYGYVAWILFPDMPYALLQSQSYFPNPTTQGQILIDAIAERA